MCNELYGINLSVSNVLSCYDTYGQHDLLRAEHSDAGQISCFAHCCDSFRMVPKYFIEKAIWRTGQLGW